MNRALQIIILTQGGMNYAVTRVMTMLKADEPVRIRVRTVHTEFLEGIIQLPEPGGGMVILVNSNRSGRQKLIAMQVASALRVRGMGTLLLNLQPRNGHNPNGRRFQLDLLSQRLTSATEWLLRQSETELLRIGYFGTGIGAAAALQAAATLGAKIGAVVSASGRPDLAPDAVGRIFVPTLFIVAGRDHLTLEFNKEAFEAIRAERRLVIIPEATHLFNEAGALLEISQLASDWFKLHLRPAFVTAVQS